MKECFAFIRLAAVLLYLLLAGTSKSSATVYEVGPGKSYPSVSSVPWGSLLAGDTVLIHYRTNAYAEKFVLCRQGTASAPITVRGVPGPAGELPILDGNGAVTRTNLNYWGESRAVLKIGGASIPADTTPKFITIENLEIRSARPPFTFTAAGGSVQSYGNNAASIWIEKGENITIRNCVLRDSGNGLFVSSTESITAKNILIERCFIYGNGNANSIYEHNVYSAAAGITFQFNRFGPLRTGCPGNNLKDRSAGLVVRYNWIEGGNRELDLVDAEDSSLLRNDPAYRSTFVYGNVLLEPNADGNKQIVHYGGDSGTTAGYRKGTLYFFNNTVVSRRPDQTTLFRLSSNDETAIVRNNILYVTNTGRSMAIVDSVGTVKLSHNWMKTGWVNCFSTLAGTISNEGFNINGTTAPGFVNEAAGDFALIQASACVNAGLSTNVHSAHPVSSQYVKHQQATSRPADAVIDIGAFEYETKLNSWKKRQFGANATNVSMSSDTSDPDADGINNLLEYAFGLDPNQPSTVGLPEGSIISAETNRFLSIHFNAIESPSGVVYTVQTSSNLVNWIDGCRYSDTTNVLSAG